MEMLLKKLPSFFCNHPHDILGSCRAFFRGVGIGLLMVRKGWWCEGVVWYSVPHSVDKKRNFACEKKQ